jgi:AcrR family transcriptional regulator
VNGSWESKRRLGNWQAFTVRATLFAVTVDAEAQNPRSWRDRRRDQTLQEIRAIALRLLEDGGPAALSLRAIARELGMTAAALYSYYDTRDDLITALIREIYDELATSLEQALAAAPTRDPARRLLTVANVYRDWAIGHPAEFQLVYGAPIPGYTPPADGAAAAAAHRACTVLVDVVSGAPARPSTEKARWADFEPAFVAAARAEHPDLTPQELALALRLWGRMHGLVSLEVYGHLPPQLRKRDKLFREEMLELGETLTPRPNGKPAG